MLLCPMGTQGLIPVGVRLTTSVPHDLRIAHQWLDADRLRYDEARFPLQCLGRRALEKSNCQEEIDVRLNAGDCWVL